MSRAAQVCRVPGCPCFRPCTKPGHEPDRRSPSSKVTGTHRWRTLKAKVLRRDGYRCQLRREGCTLIATTVDHVRPVAKGGAPYDESNLVASCFTCNARKGGR